MVFIAGGILQTNQTINFAETYSPTGSGSHQSLMSLSTTRGSPTATLVNNGKVLIAGGISGGTTLSNVELYEPNAPASTTVLAPLAHARWGHTATLLNNGKVLIAGGSDTNGMPLSSVELYDPAAGGSTRTLAPLSTARYLHTATPLDNGTVLFLGGNGGANGPPISSVELYNPSSAGTTLSLAPLSVARVNHTATLLGNGSILVVGGAMGGGLPSNASSVEIYDPAANGSTASLSPLIVNRERHTANLLDSGKVLIVGGNTDQSIGITSVELYNPIAFGTTQLLTPLSKGRFFHTTTSMEDGSFLIIGCATTWINGLTPTDSVELYRLGL